MAPVWNSIATPVSYSTSAKLMHWFVAAAVIVLLALGPVMKRLVPEGSLRDNLYTFHEALGALVLIVMVVRLVRRLAFGVPAPDAAMPPVEQQASLWAQYALYALLIRHDRARLGRDQRLRRPGQRLWFLRLSNHSRQGSAAVGPHHRLASHLWNSDRCDRRPPYRGRALSSVRQRRSRLTAHAARELSIARHARAQPSRPDR